MRPPLSVEAYLFESRKALPRGFLAELPECQACCLSDNSLSLAELPALAKLEYLNIERCNLTSLKGLSRCQAREMSCSLYGTSWPKGVAELGCGEQPPLRCVSQTKRAGFSVVFLHLSACSRSSGGTKTCGTWRVLVFQGAEFWKTPDFTSYVAVHRGWSCKS